PHGGALSGGRRGQWPHGVACRGQGPELACGHGDAPRELLSVTRGDGAAGSRGAVLLLGTARALSKGRADQGGRLARGAAMVHRLLRCMGRGVSPWDLSCPGSPLGVSP